MSKRNQSKPKDWNRRRRHVLKRDRRVCYLCGRLAVAQVDHIIPVAEDGSHEYDNLAAICSPCHQEKSRRERRGR